MALTKSNIKGLGLLVSDKTILKVLLIGVHVEKNNLSVKM